MKLPLLALLVLASACATTGSHVPIEAVSLLGQPLPRPRLDDAAATARLEDELAQAREAWRREPSESSAIWVGRRLAYLGRYREAIAWYTEALERFPESYRLLRHRGHRWITVRELDAAVDDLERAAMLMRGTADELEPDGAPNPFGLPRGTDHTSVWYHLGLAEYLRGEYGAAVTALRTCHELAPNDDMRVAALDWLYKSLRRAGLHREAREAVAGLGPYPDVIENFAYLRLVRLYQGRLQPSDLLAREREAGVDDATILYGVGSWSLENGNLERGTELLARAAATPAWPAFGCIAAEADLARLRR